MSISIRLDATTEQTFRQYLQLEQVSMSDFVRDAINEKLATYEAERSKPYELGKDLFGKYASGRDDLSQNRKMRLKEKLNAKHRR